jgi:hypothetical protein
MYLHLLLLFNAQSEKERFFYFILGLFQNAQRLISESDSTGQAAAASAGAAGAACWAGGRRLQIIHHAAALRTW